MKKIYSKLNNELLHLVYNTNEKINERIDLIEASNFIQCSIVPNNKKGYKYRPHFHNFNELTSNKIQIQDKTHLSTFDEVYNNQHCDSE